MIKIVRPLNVVIGFLSAFVVAAVANISISPDIVLSGLAIGFFIGAGNAINDFYDFETDCLNHPKRPLPSGLISKKTALLISWILFGCGFFTVFMMSNFYLPFGIALFAFAVLIAYSRWWKKTVLIGNFAVSALLGLAFVFTGASIGDIAPTLPPAFLAFGLTIIREIVKDLQDYDGDISAKMKTLPIVMGKGFSIRLIHFFSIVFVLISPLPFFLKIYDQFYFGILIFGVIFPLLFLNFSMLKHGEKTDLNFFSGLLKLSIIAGLVAVFFGKTNQGY